MSSSRPGVIDHAAQTAYSDPGEWAHLLDPLPTDAAHLSHVARNLIVHYRSADRVLPIASAGDINLRWLSDQLATDQRRHGAPLHEEREPEERLQGCCRDHSLFCVSVLRHKGIPARTRLGFAHYFSAGWQGDHVIVEAWNGSEWFRFDPEIEMPSAALPTPLEIPAGPGSPFETAAEAWRSYRAGADVSNYGVEGVSGVCGPAFVRDEVIYEVAHRFGDELLLWDGWGAMQGPDGDAGADVELIDQVAQLLVEADSGDLAAEQDLLTLYRQDARLHPGATVEQFGPDGTHAKVTLRPQPG
ncbi:transglutaminase-like domain-containing protein [Luteipulveratus mongoliensis]|uniref:Transglutaminase-like domain-containing protein n=1 Tax=Luteipulveratus mongoliensis TaxID=571913 RepID=A0A0K1JM02_9MICO|nr:transglutaminase-like domain-containing protein [Luteipulveratus mongoliensis]AKU17737.1 hypothetical protein VV02_20935 [Luteipulveratus mongoliensis]